MKRRTFLKGLVAAPVITSVSGWDWIDIFKPDDDKAIASNELPSNYAIIRNAVSLGPPPVTIAQIKSAKSALQSWVISKEIGRYAKNFRFMYMLDDHDNDVGIGVAVYNTLREDVGMTWGQMIREMKKEDLLI